MGLKFHSDVVHSRSASNITEIVNPTVGGTVRAIAIAREGGDSVLYHSLT